MNRFLHNWAVVLAAGNGSPLPLVTTESGGNPMPKQFCSLKGGGSPLYEALQRANRIAPRERVCAIVTDQQRPYWHHNLWPLPGANVIVQPDNRGTAHGILLTVLSILRRDPLAQILFLPAEHYVVDDIALAGSLHEAVHLSSRDKQALVLVGIEPDEADPELGYIVPGQVLGDGSYTVQRLVENPPPTLASELLSRGALWNSRIFAVNGALLLDMLRRRIAFIVEEMASALAADSDAHSVDELYRRFESVDFTYAIAQGAERSLRLVSAPPCGWTDLGTAKRVADTLRRLDRLASRPRLNNRFG